MNLTHLNRSNTAKFVLFSLVSACASGISHAQTSASLLIKPWEADQAFEDKSRLMFFAGGHSQDTGRSFDLTSFESQGRVRILPGNEASPRLGYDVTYLNTHSGQPGFPGQLLDASVAAGSFLSQSKSTGWVTGLTLGVGYAGDVPFADGRAWYGKADFVLAKKFSDIDALGIGVEYDGHRTYAQDIPLPGFGWSHQLDPTLLMVIGVPVTSITWKPDPRLRIYADYVMLTDFDVDIGFEVLKHWTVFGAMETRDDAFYVESLKGHHRLMYTQRRIEAGVRWEPVKFVTVSLSGGYGFDTRFENGWDYRNTKSVLHASPEPFVAMALSVQF
jgi:hypothetical protein